MDSFKIPTPDAWYDHTLDDLHYLHKAVKVMEQCGEPTC